MVNNQHYLYRMTVLVAITSLASVVSHETLYQTILPAVVSCAKDKVSKIHVSLESSLPAVRCESVAGTVMLQSIHLQDD